MRFPILLLSFLLVVLSGFSPRSEARAVTLGEALGAYALIERVDAMPPEQRTDFIRTHRPELNHALEIRQVVGVIVHTVETTSLASQRLYRQPLVCPPDEDDEEEAAEAGEERQSEAETLGRLPDMAAAFKTEMKKALNLPDTPETEKRLNGIDVTDAVTNRMLQENRCPEAQQRASTPATH